MICIITWLEVALMKCPNEGKMKNIKGHKNSLAFS